jgi:hypothetical protein
MATPSNDEFALQIRTKTGVPNTLERKVAGFSTNYLLALTQDAIDEVVSSALSLRKTAPDVKQFAHLTEQKRFLKDVLTILLASQRLKKSGNIESRRFERLIANLSAILFGGPASRIDSALDRSLGQTVVALDLDRSVIAQVEAGSHSLRVTHQWSRAGFVNMPLHYDLGANIPWYARQILLGVEVSYSRPQELLPGILIEKGNFGGILPWSHFGCPFRVAGEVAGFVGFDTLAQERKWSPRIAQRLRLIAAVFGNAIARIETTVDATDLREEPTQVVSASTNVD